MKYSGAEIIVKLLELQGIDTVSGIPGGSNLPLYNALSKSKIRHILARHEQGAGFFAQGMARTTGKPAVCLATSGPGITNMITAIADAKLDSIPIVIISGQVPTSMIGTDAFQEVDTYGMTLPVTKHNVLINSAEELLEVVPRAFEIAGSGRPGPVLIDVPKDVQAEIIEVDTWPEIPRCNHEYGIDESVLDSMAEMIEQAQRPVIYAGGGIIHAEAAGILYQFARKNGIPVTLTLMGLGAFPPDDPLYLGMLGMHGAPYTNYILEEADLIIALGVRFDDRATGKVEGFCPNARIIHVDIDSAEIDKIKKSDISITGNVKTVLDFLINKIGDDSRGAWNNKILDMKKQFPLQLKESADPLNPVTFLKSLSVVSEPGSIITTDVGQHQMWVAQVFPFSAPRTFLTSGGLGTMGFGLPVAIGAALANPDKKIICISGDGSIQMNIQEFATLAELKLNVALFILNNDHLGLVRQQQELFYEQNYIASQFHVNPDFAAVARDFGIMGVDLSLVENPVDTVIKMLAQNGPCVINVPIHFQENVFPIVPPGASNKEMIGVG